MKPNFIPITVAAGLLLAATNSGWALAPRQHSVSGVVEAINCASRTITLKPKNEAAPLTFVWNDSTRFTKKGGCARCSFDSGQAIRVSYRREVGQNVLRRVSLRSDAATGCKPGGCCAPETVKTKILRTPEH